MAHVSRPLIGLLVATVAFFALWTLALKPSSSSSSPSGTGPGLGAYQSAINKAKTSAASQNAAAAAANGATATTGAGAPATATPATAKPATAGTAATAPRAAAKHATPTAAHRATASAAKPTAAAHHASRVHAKTSPRPAPAPPAATAAQRVNEVDRALAAHKVLALLIYNPAGPEDQAVKQELATIQTHGGRVVKLAIPLGEVTNYPVVTNQVQIESSPTLVIVDPSRQAYTMVGFADSFEIAQRIDNALTVR